MGKPWTYLEVKRSKVKVTQTSNAVTDNAPYADRSTFCYADSTHCSPQTTLPHHVICDSHPVRIQTSIVSLHRHSCKPKAGIFFSARFDDPVWNPATIPRPQDVITIRRECCNEYLIIAAWCTAHGCRRLVLGGWRKLSLSMSGSDSILVERLRYSDILLFNYSGNEKILRPRVLLLLLPARSSVDIGQ